jgi:hypothetical protein
MRGVCVEDRTLLNADRTLTVQLGEVDLRINFAFGQFCPIGDLAMKTDSLYAQLPAIVTKARDAVRKAFDRPNWSHRLYELRYLIKAQKIGRFDEAWMHVRDCKTPLPVLTPAKYEIAPEGAVQFIAVIQDGYMQRPRLVKFWMKPENAEKLLKGRPSTKAMVLKKIADTSRSARYDFYKVDDIRSA